MARTQKYTVAGSATSAPLSGKSTRGSWYQTHTDRLPAPWHGSLSRHSPAAWAGEQTVQFGILSASASTSSPACGAVCPFT